MPRRFAREVIGSGRDAHRFLLGIVLVGIGQQLFVVLRNLWLLQSELSPQQITTVQAWGGFAGIAAGFASASLMRRLDSNRLLALAVLCQAFGFGLQLAAHGHLTLIGFGAVLAGLGIQILTAVSPVYLRVLVDAPSRTSLFTASGIALFPLAGLCSAGIIAMLRWAFGSEEVIARAGLEIAIGTTIAAVFFMQRTGPIRLAGRRPVGRTVSPRVVPVIAIYALLCLAAGMTVPFLQIYLRMRFDASSSVIASLYAGGMVLSVLGGLLVPALVRRFGLWQTVVGLQIAILPSYVLLGVGSAIKVAVLGFLGRDVANRAASSAFQQLGQEVVGIDNGPHVASYSVVVGAAAWGAGNYICGPLLSSAENDFTLVFLVCAAIHLVAVSLAMVSLPRLWKSRPDMGG